MISFNVDKNKFNFRVSAIIMDSTKTKFLTNTSKNIDFCVMPGGRVEMGEDTPTTIVREIQEELGCDIVVKGLKVVAENFFNFDGMDFHELQYVYIAEFVNHDFEDKDGSFMGVENKDIYNWVDIKDIEKVNYKPPEIIPAIKEVFEGNYDFRHIIIHQI
ncbi:MAG: NUDIX domain-containing protein [Clostridia bacterium]|nr:NUDIX domain-containing protein [Clostridia bacterium]